MPGYDDGVVHQRMTPAEWRAFLTTGTRTAVLGTTRIDGCPHAAPVSIVLDGDDVRRAAFDIGVRYHGAAAAEGFVSQVGVPGTLLVRVRPTRVVAVDGVAA